MPKWPSSAVAARNSSRCVRPVVWATGPPRWAPSISGGTSSEVQRWIRCRSTASMVSLRPDPVGAGEHLRGRSGRRRWRRSRSPGRDARPAARRAAGRTPASAVHGRPPGVGDVDQVAVVVPLEVGDVVLLEQAQQRVAHVGVGARAPGGRAPAGAATRAAVAPAAQHPVGVGAREVGVLVDHLRLDPQPELHAEPLDLVDQRVQALRPHLRVDGPVAQPGPVVSPAAEPAVVEHEPLDADLGRGPGELGEPVEVVVEVRRLPGVDQHRAGAARAWGVPPQPAVDPGAGGVEARGRSRRRPARARCRSHPRPARPRRVRAARRRRAGTRPPASARRTSRGRRSRRRARPRPRRARSRSRACRPP